VGDGDDLTAASGLTPDQSASVEAPLDDLPALAARLEAQLDRIDAEQTEPARSCLMVEAVLTARSVVARWNAVKEHLPRTVDDRTTHRVNSLIARLLRLPGAPRDPGLGDSGPVVLQVRPDRHLDGVDELKAAYARHAQALASLSSAKGWMHACLGPDGAQMLVDEALHRLEIERISQVRDARSLVKRTEPSRVDPSLPPWLLMFDQVRHGPPVDWATVADADIWPRLSTRDRAEAVSDRVRSVLDSEPEYAVNIRPSDIVNATNGDFEAWQRLVVDPPKDDDWWQKAHQSSSLPHGTLFASRSDLTPAERADRDFLRGKWDDIERSRRELRIAHALATIHPSDPETDREAERRREARHQQLDDEERDLVAALQKYSVMPRQSLTDSVRVDATPRGEPSASGEPTVAASAQNRVAAQAHLAGLELQHTILSRQASTAAPGNEAVSAGLTTPARAGDASREADEVSPLKCLVGRDAEWVRLWKQGRTASEIAGQYSVTRKTVANRIGDLRNEHGAEAVPYHRQRNQKDKA
jgi:hypothetical protein